MGMMAKTLSEPLKVLKFAGHRGIIRFYLGIMPYRNEGCWKNWLGDFTRW
jgi:hypothetical protein